MLSILRKLSLAALAVLLALVLVEGSASLFVLAYDLARWSQGVGGRSFEARYDAELGWVPRAGLSEPDAYGTGNSLVTDSRGFRESREKPETLPEGKTRLLCLGDSFTFGEGVGNDATWVRQLESLDARLETVNLGVAGYGVDQAYLRYLRDGALLQHGVVVLAFITADFERMRAATFHAFGKPRLALRSGKLLVENVPVPHHGTLRRWMTYNDPILGQLAFVRLGRRLTAALRPAGGEADLLDAPRTFEVAEAMLVRLRDVARERDSALVLVHLPVLREPDGAIAAELPGFLRQLASREGIPVVDLLAPFSRIPRGEVGGLFIDAADAVHAADSEHYTVAGHRWVAEALHAALPEIPGIRERLVQPATGD